MDVTARIEVAMLKRDRFGREGLLVGLRCEPQLEGLEGDALVWERYVLDDPQSVHQACQFLSRFGVECAPEDLEPDTIGPVLRRARRTPPRPVSVRLDRWANGEGSSWRVARLPLTPVELQAFAARWRHVAQALPPWKRTAPKPAAPAALLSDEDLPF